MEKPAWNKHLAATGMEKERSKDDKMQKNAEDGYGMHAVPSTVTPHKTTLDVRIMKICGATGGPSTVC